MEVYMASKQSEILNELTPESIANDEFPAKALLYNSVYYPASGFDGGIIRDCNVNRKDWNVLSFVYVDYQATERSLAATDMPRGYKLLGERRLKVSNLEHYKYVVNKHPFATWMVFERRPEFGDSHGPKRFSLLYLCADGVAAYQALYWTHGLHPRAIAIIQPGTGFGGNWTDFFMANEPFHWTVSHNPSGMPDFVYCGYWSCFTATSPKDKPDHIHFDWPGYSYWQPAVGYPHREVFIYKYSKNDLL